MHYTTIYQISQNGIVQLILAQPIIAVVLAFIVLMTIIVFSPGVSQLEKIIVSLHGRKLNTTWVQAVVIIGDVFVAGIMLVLHNMLLQGQTNLLDAYQRDKCEQLEGKITQLQSAYDKSAGKYKSFIVNGHKFLCYESPFLKPGLEFKIANKLKEGQLVRIWDWGNAIAKLDVASSEVSE